MLKISYIYFFNFFLKLVERNEKQKRKLFLKKYYLLIINYNYKKDLKTSY